MQDETRESETVFVAVRLPRALCARLDAYARENGCGTAKKLGRSAALRSLLTRNLPPLEREGGHAA